jgi:dipeptidyl aminopeptidase/acylaminoacyl peptidase
MFVHQKEKNAFRGIPKEARMNTLKPLFSILALLMMSGLALAAPAAGTFTLEQVLSAPYPTNLVSARNADRIAWVFNIEGARNIWTAAAPDYMPVNLTGYVKDEVFEIPDVEITADGAVVIFVRGGNPNSRGWVTNPTSDPDGFEQAIWAVRTDGGNPWRDCAGNNPAVSPDGKWLLVVRDNLIYRIPLRDPSPSAQAPEPELLFKAAGRNGSPVWSPDQTRVAFVSNRDDHSFVGVYDLAKRKITWLAPSVDRDSNPVWSPDGKSIAFFRRPGAQYNEVFDYFNPPTPAVWVADAETGAGKELWAPPDAEPKFYLIRDLMWTAKSRILFTAEHDEWNHFFGLSPEGGAEPEDLTPGDGMVEHFSLSSDGGTLFYSSNQADIHGRHIFKVAVGEAGGKPVALTKGATIGCHPVALASGKEVAFVQATAREPMSVALIPAAGGKSRIIAPRALPEEFPLDELVVPELVIVKAPDGLDIPCQLFLPRGAKPGDRRPGVVYTHGGPVRQMLLGWHYMEFYAEAYGINQYFANQGYVVISINYRSGIGYGRRFRMPPDAGRRGASEYQDLVAGAKYLQARPEVDPERVGLWGLSYGGLLTAMGLARNSDIFKAGVDMAGVHDWSARSRDPRPGASQGMSPEERKVAFESSPVAAVKTWKSPVLFVHGDDDRNVDFSQTVDLVQKLRAKGDVHVELLVRPDEPHEFMLHKNRLDAYNATFEFLKRFLSGSGQVK